MSNNTKSTSKKRDSENVSENPPNSVVEKEESLSETEKTFLPEEILGEAPEHIKANLGDGKPPEWLWLTGSEELSITIYAYKDGPSNRLLGFFLSPNLPYRIHGIIEYPMESKWTIPDKTKLDNLREESSNFRPALGRTILNKTVFTENLIRNHLVSLDIEGPDKTSKLKLDRDRKGRLTNETMELLNKLHPSVLELLCTKFLNETSIIL